MILARAMWASRHICTWGKTELIENEWSNIFEFTTFLFNTKTNVNASPVQNCQLADTAPHYLGLAVNCQPSYRREGS